MPYPYRVHRCEYCKKMAVTFPHGRALCSIHAADPDSLVYVVKLEEAKIKYLNLYGVVQWDAFCLRAFNNNYESFTWKEISEAAERELENPAECTCTPRDDCSTCNSIAQVIYE